MQRRVTQKYLKSTPTTFERCKKSSFLFLLTPMSVLVFTFTRVTCWTLCMAGGTIPARCIWVGNLGLKLWVFYLKIIEIFLKWLNDISLASTLVYCCSNSWIHKLRSKWNLKQKLYKKAFFGSSLINKPWWVKNTLYLIEDFHCINVLI